MRTQNQLRYFLAGVAAVLAGLGPRSAAAAIDCENNGVITNEPIPAGGTLNVTGGQVSLAGATLFVDFFLAAASSNDYIDCDNDGFSGFDPDTFPFVDQLGTQYVPGNSLNTYFMVQYRSVGSVNGFNEFVLNQLCGTIPTSVPAEAGVFNGFRYAPQAGSNPPVPSWGGAYGNASGTPFPPCGIDLAFLDVPSFWAVIDTSGVPSWDRNPGEPGYGAVSVLSSTGYDSRLLPIARDCDTNGSAESELNFDLDNADTIYDLTAAWVPVAFISNRGTGVENFRYSEAQHLFVAGRMSNGENLVGSTRSVGSGTRNAIMNSVGIDTSWARGENVGNEFASTATGNLGANHQASNAQGSSQIEQVIRNRRLAIGYTGLAGPSRAAQDAQAGNYEVLNVCKDIDADGDGFIESNCTPTQAGECLAGPVGPSGIPIDFAAPNNGYVRPKIGTVLDNCDPRCGYAIGGNGSFVSRGDPDANRDPGDPAYEAAHPAMDNEAAACYLNNIVDSTCAFAGNVNSNGLFNMPGQFLAVTFFLPNGLDCAQELTDPTSLTPQDPISPEDCPSNGLNQILQDYMRQNNGLGIGQDTPHFGAINTAGFVPIRVTLTGGQTYSDGSTANYIDAFGASVTNSLRLSERNRISGDFNYVGADAKKRNWNDIPRMMLALCAPRAFEQNVNWGGNAGTMPGGRDSVVVEVIGDFDGDGNFDRDDIRYFADGLATDPAAPFELDRKKGFTDVDTAWDALPGPCAGGANDNNFFNTALGTPKSYAPGDSRGDVAKQNGTGPIAGAHPAGSDGHVGCGDINYCAEVINNSLAVDGTGDWRNLDMAVYSDLSCDMNGDLAITAADMDELIEVILGTDYGDVDTNGVVNGADLVIAQSNLGQPGGWCEGDVTGPNGVPDGTVDQSDIDVIQGVPAATALSALSRRTNPSGPGGNCDAVDNSSPFKVTEPHAGGVNHMRIGFNTAPGGGGSGWTLEQRTCAAPVYAPYSGAAVGTGSVVGNELVINFTPALENARTYRINLGPSMTSIAGQSVEVRGLAGDATANGLVDSGDRSAVVGAWTGPGSFSCVTDITNNGQTNSGDRSAVVGAWTNPAANCAP